MKVEHWSSKNNITIINPIAIYKNFTLNKGQLLFTKNRYTINFSDIAFVKVGAVSGADRCFEHPEGIEFVCSYTNKIGKTKKMIYNSYHKDLEKYMDMIISKSNYSLIMTTSRCCLKKD